MNDVPNPGIPGTPSPPPGAAPPAGAATTPGAPEAPITTPAAAMAKLDALRADPAWRESFISGHPVLAAQWRDLTELSTRALAGNETEAALAGRLEPSGFQPPGRLENIAMVEMLRGLEFSDAAIRETINGHEMTQAEHDAAKRWKSDKMGDKEWVARYLAGDAVAKREKMLADVILASPIKGKENAA